MKIRLNITLDVDPVVWVAERGENQAGVREDVRWWARDVLLNGSTAISAATIGTDYRPAAIEGLR